MHKLAVLYKEKVDYDKAEPLLLEAIKGRLLKLGDTHPHTLESWKNKSTSTKLGTNRKKPKSGEQNCCKQKLWTSDIMPSK